METLGSSTIKRVAVQLAKDLEDMENFLRDSVHVFPIPVASSLGMECFLVPHLKISVSGFKDTRGELDKFPEALETE